MPANAAAMPTHGRELACVGSGQDASFAVDMPWPEPRFEMLHAGMLDRLTDLLWRRSANLTPQPVVWGEALAAVAKLNHETSETTWRLPTINELESRVDCAAHSPALSSGHPFADVQDLYWSSTARLKARRALGKSGSHSFRCGPWQRSAK